MPRRICGSFVEDDVRLRRTASPILGFCAKRRGRYGRNDGARQSREKSKPQQALSDLEFTHAWAGTWDAIDPAFDDDFGHYGARAATAALAGGEEAFGRFAEEGLEHFLPLWRDALRLGGNVAADQVRCWLLALDVARLDRSYEARVRPLLAEWAAKGGKK